MLTKDQICRKFLDNPRVYPENPNKSLRRGYGPFNGYVKLCRELGYDYEVDVLLGLKIESTTKIEKEEKLLTGNYGTDVLLLEAMDNQTLNNFEVNEAFRKILNDQEFWKRRLYQRLGLISKNNIDYRHVTKFLDNNKSFEENYQKAIRKNETEVKDVLLKNNVVLVNKPYSLLRGRPIDFSELADIKYYSYDEFIQYVLNRVNQSLSNHEKINIEDFNTKVYYGDGIMINIPVYLHDPFDQKLKYQTIVLTDKHGFTNGEIFYQMSQFIPDEEEIKMFNLQFIEDNAVKIFEIIEKRRKELEDRIKENRRWGYPISEIDKEDLNNLNKNFSSSKVKELLLNPAEYLEYILKFGSPYYGLIIKQTYAEVFGFKALFKGLYYNQSEGYYQIQFEYSY